MLAIITVLLSKVHNLDFCNKNFLSWRNPFWCNIPPLMKMRRGKKRGMNKKKSSIWELISHTGMPTQSMEALSSLTIGCINVTIPCSSTYQNSSTTFWAFHKCQVSNCPIMHTKFQIRSWNSNKNFKKRRCSTYCDNLRLLKCLQTDQE